MSWVRTLSSALNLAKDASPLHKKTFAMNLLRCMPNHNHAQMNEMALDLSQGVFASAYVADAGIVSLPDLTFETTRPNA